MIQDQYTSRQLQDIIEKYRKELLASYQKKSLSDLEPAAQVNQPQPEREEISPSGVLPMEEDREEYYPSPPFVLQPFEEIQTTSEPVWDKAEPPPTEVVMQGFSLDEPEEDCPPPPSMLRPFDEAQAMSEPVWDEAEPPPTEVVIPGLSLDEPEEDCPPPPSMLRPFDEAQAMSEPVWDEEKPAPVEIVFQDFSYEEPEEDFPPPPSMLRPCESASTDAGLLGEDELLAETLLHTFIEDEDECPLSPSMLRACEMIKKEAFSSMPEPELTSALLQIKVTSGRQAVPVNGARVTVSRPGASAQRVQVNVQTDGSGSTPVLAIPACDPPAPCTIEANAPGYCGARYSGIPLYGGITAIQQIDLIPLPVGQKSDLLILFDETPT